jgi:hypothetical protein
MLKTTALTAGVLLSLALASNAQAQTILYGTNFESPTFSVGALGDAYAQPASGQDGWQTTPRAAYTTAPSPWVLVTTQRAWSGTQSVQLAQDAQTFGTVSMGRLVGNPGVALNSPTDPFRLSMMLYLDQEASSDLPWALTLTTGSCCGLTMTLRPDNQVGYAQSAANFGQTFSPGFSLKKTWLSVAIERDPLDYTSLRLSIGNGSQSWQQSVTSPGGTMPYVSFGAVMPTFPTSPYGTAYVDDFQMGYNIAAVPEPGSWALLLIGGLAMGRTVRRQRQPR